MSYKVRMFSDSTKVGEDQVDGVPTVCRLETREPDVHRQFFPSKKPFERFTQSICQTLYRGSRHMLPATSFEVCRQIILRGERTAFLILLFGDLKHLIIEHARLPQAPDEQSVLLLIWIQAVFKSLHSRDATANRL